MFLVKLKHVGKEGTFTIEEQSATDEVWAQKKYTRMIVKWFEILCPHIDWVKYQIQMALCSNEDENTIAIECICNHLKYLNSQDNANRSFSISIFEDEDFN